MLPPGPAFNEAYVWLAWEIEIRMEERCAWPWALLSMQFIGCTQWDSADVLYLC